MLKNLLIQNIILVEHADIPFEQGLNILTGETGSGKSAIMYGLNLAFGERTDSSLLRKGCEKGTVEAIFNMEGLDPLIQLLYESGFDHSGPELIIKREISSSGKSRLFINHQAAQLSFLKLVGQHLVQMVGQHANQKLLSTDYHRSVIDLFGDLESLLKKFKESHNKENILRLKLKTLIEAESQRLREIDISQSELEELEEARIKLGEDEELFTEYSLLINSEELHQKAEEVNQAFSGDKHAILMPLNRLKNTMEALALLDPSIEETSKAFQNAFLELQEISYTMRNYKNRVHSDPERLQRVNERLGLLNKLKRKYGATLADVLAYQEATQTKLQSLLNADVEIEETQKLLASVEQETHSLANELTTQRQFHGQTFAYLMTEQLHSLNMKKAQFLVQVSTQKRSSEGDDKVEFFLLPNVGEHQIALKEGASGGEISRVLLALQTIMAGKEQTPTLIFDEVDANIGGETASIVGEKLKAISQRHQVICITHFPQVATQAQHHLQISKQEKEGRTITQVVHLSTSQRKQELARMAGKLGTRLLEPV